MTRRERDDLRTAHPITTRLLADPENRPILRRRGTFIARTPWSQGSSRAYAWFVTMRVPSRKTRREKEVLLLVEDEVLVRWMLADYLRQCGYRILEASNAAEALALLETSRPINLVLSDVHMPGEMDGFGLARWIRANRPGTKVILTSGIARSAELAGELCADGPIEAKPYDPQRLRERIRSTLV